MLSQNGQHGLHILCGIATEAGQIPAIGLIGKIFFKEAFGGRNMFRGSGLMNFQTFLGTVQGKECEDFQFGNQLRGKRHKDSRLSRNWTRRSISSSSAPLLPSSG